MNNSDMPPHYDYAIVGGGIIGTSVAWQLQQRRPNCSIILLEKEADVAHHQTGRNSGVIHAGVYYQPGSLKADFCKRGAQATLDFCQQYNIDVKQPGKLLVASSPLEHERMLALKQRCDQNGIATEILNQQTLHEYEPNITGLGALLVEQSGIVDYRKITEAMAKEFQQKGGKLQLGTEITAVIEDSLGIQITTNKGYINTDYMICCAGLMSDRLTKMLNIEVDFSIIPFRGEYYQLASEKSSIVSRLIYPIPDPALPFLGVHLTPTIGGDITVGPNAVLGWKREGYKRYNFSMHDSLEMLLYPGFWRLAAKQFKSGIGEFKDSLYKYGYLKRVQKYCPSLTSDDLIPWPTGIRAQAVKRDGSLVEDFLFAESPRSLHVCNAPSPAATSAIPIGEYICDKVFDKVP